jgi:PKD repeat protein
MKRLLIVLVMAVLVLAGCMPKADAGKDKNILNGLEISLDAAGSTVKLGKLVSYDWDFGDGSQASGLTQKHKYAAAGSYEVVLTVKDNTGIKSTDLAVVNVVDFAVLETPVNAAGHIIEAPLVDFLPDGRMVIAEGNSSSMIEIAIETAKGSKAFNYVTGISPLAAGSFGSFVKAVDSETLILGASTYILKVNISTKAVEVLTETPNFDAALSNGRLYFTRSTYNPDWSANTIVSSIDLSSPGLVTDIITGIPGASAGVCLDGKGNIYTGNGYSNFGIPNETGLVKRFALTGAVQNWSNGEAIARLLSATPLIYCESGAILTGGGDLYGSGDAGYFAAVNIATGDKVLELDPDASDDSYYRLNANNGQFAASIWDYINGTGKIYIIPFDALGL